MCSAWGQRFVGTRALSYRHMKRAACAPVHIHACPRHTLVHVRILPLSDMHREVRVCACTPGAHVQCVVRKPELAALHGQGHCSSLSPRDVPSQARRADTPIRDSYTADTQLHSPTSQASRTVSHIEGVQMRGVGKGFLSKNS